MQLLLRTIVMLACSAAILWPAAGCVESASPHADRCLEGTTPTPDGCRAVPDWNPWRRDAGARDGGASPAARDAGGPAVDAGLSDAGTETPTVTPSRDGGTAPEPLEGLSGTWAMRVVNTQVLNHSYLGQGVVSSVMVGVVDVVHAGDRAELRTRICAVEAEPFGEMTTTFGAGFIGALGVTDTEAVLPPSRPGTDLAGASFTPTPRRVLVGWAAATDPDTEALPSEPLDPRVYDADGDGEPGVTLPVSGSVNGDMRIVQRSRLELDGTIERVDRIRGTSRTLIERVTLSASNPLLMAGEITREPHPDPDRSPFEMDRLPYGAGCADAVAWFAARP